MTDTPPPPSGPPPGGPRVPCVGAIVRDETGRWLLIRRGTDPGRGQWSIPGGRVEAGESLAAAVAREVQEETGLTVTVGPVAGVVERAGRGGSTYEITDFLCTALPGDPRAGDDADEARWVPADDLASYDLVDGLLDALRGWGLLSD